MDTEDSSVALIHSEKAAGKEFSAAFFIPGIF
jgi:hypothetical protein